MATRKEQREEARAARQEREAAERERVRRRRRVWQVGAGLVGVAAIVIAVIAVSSSSGGGGKPGPSSGKTPPIPAAKIPDLTQAAAAAGCQLNSYTFNPTTDRTHLADGQTVHYKTNPPSYGAHYQTPASDGDYVSRSTPALGNLVHALEHGRIEIQYRPGLPKNGVGQLETLFNEPMGSFGPGALMLLFSNTSGMPYDVAAAAWAHTLTCPHFNPRVFDALRDFRATYTLKAPEQIPEPE
ncbi:MAG: hypothetical protein NVSMB25_05180 [Thermoleophilaceae bacterium]